MYQVYEIKMYYYYIFNLPSDGLLTVRQYILVEQFVGISRTFEKDVNVFLTCMLTFIK